MGCVLLCLSLEDFISTECVRVFSTFIFTLSVLTTSHRREITKHLHSLISFIDLLSSITWEDPTILEIGLFYQNLEIYVNIYQFTKNTKNGYCLIIDIIFIIM